MPRTRQSTSARHSGEVSTIGGTTSIGGHTTTSRTTTTFIIVVSLLFVAIFGGALVGGVVSGDPSNKFFIIIVASSGVAISIAVIVTLRYYCKTCLLNNHDDQDHLNNKNRGTFCGSDAENPEEDEDHYNAKRNSNRASHRHNYHGRTPVEARIKEIQAQSVAGVISALSPHSYDVESLSTRRDLPISQKIIHRRQQMKEQRGALFDFSNVSPTRPSPKIQAREDPPEGVGQATYHAALIVRGKSQDPDAYKLNENGEIVKFDEDEKGLETGMDLGLNSFSDNSIPSPQSNRSRYDIGREEPTLEQVTEENTVVGLKTPLEQTEGVSPVTKTESDSQNVKRGRSTSRRERRRRSMSRSASRSRSRSKSPFAKVEKRHKVPRLPTSTKSATVIAAPRPSDAHVTGTTSTPTTPAGSDVGSIASSIFKPLNGLFGKKGSNYASSEAGQSEARSSFIESSDLTADQSTNVSKQRVPSTSKTTILMGAISEGKPPKMPDKKQPYTGTINGTAQKERTMPSTPGNESVYSIPAPRRVPSTPGGLSEIFSEFRSVAGSGVASSTFDPSAHDKALRKMQKIQGHLGASALGEDSSMPIFYEEDDKASSVAASSVAPVAAAYDVFAPSGAIGIVVDTTKKGCVVHSLKKSSPMRGLMNPGDLIIALDDFDVRKMTAASLTKLMAKKSQQPERKFTLVPADYV